MATREFWATRHNFWVLVIPFVVVALAMLAAVVVL